MVRIEGTKFRAIWRSRMAAVAMLALGALLSSAPARAEGEDSLYKRVGGYEVIAAIAADFTRGLGTDPVLRPYFFARSDDSRRRILQMFRELLCADAGGPCFYAGRDMTTAHKGMPIGEKEWTALMALWDSILTRHKVEGREKADMTQLFAKYQGVIVSAKPQ